MGGYIKVNPRIALPFLRTPVVEMCMGMGFPMRTAIPWEWE